MLTSKTGCRRHVFLHLGVVAGQPLTTVKNRAERGQEQNPPVSCRAVREEGAASGWRMGNAFMPNFRCACRGYSFCFVWNFQICKLICRQARREHPHVEKNIPSGGKNYSLGRKEYFPREEKPAARIGVACRSTRKPKGLSRIFKRGNLSLQAGVSYAFLCILTIIKSHDSG